MVADGPAGGASLDRAALNELKLIRRAAASVGRHAYVAVQIDLKTRPKIRRQVIGRHATLGREQNAASPRTLNGFFNWVQTECPARRHLLIFWGHADGPVGLFQDTGSRQRQAETLSLPELRSAFEHAAALFKRPIDVVLFKDCWFSTLETIYQLEGLATYAIASPSIVVPRYGWPYRQMFRCLIGTRAVAPTVRRAATGILAALASFYEVSGNRRDRSDDPTRAALQRRLNAGDVGRENMRDEVPFALLDPAALPSVGTALTRLVRALGSVRRNADCHRALARAVRGDAALLDVTLLCRRLLELQGACRRLHRDARAVLRAVGRLIVARCPEQSAFGGVSVFYFPAGTEDRLDSFIALMTDIAEYKRLKLCQATGWNRVALENVPIQQR